MIQLYKVYNLLRLQAPTHDSVRHEYSRLGLSKCSFPRLMKGGDGSLVFPFLHATPPRDSQVLEEIYKHSHFCGSNT